MNLEQCLGTRFGGDTGARDGWTRQFRRFFPKSPILCLPPTTPPSTTRPRAGAARPRGGPGGSSAGLGGERRLRPDPFRPPGSHRPAPPALPWGAAGHGAAMAAAPVSSSFCAQFHLILFKFTSFHFILCHFISRYFVLFGFISLYPTLFPAPPARLFSPVRRCRPRVRGGRRRPRPLPALPLPHSNAPPPPPPRATPHWCPHPSSFAYRPAHQSAPGASLTCRERANQRARGPGHHVLLLSFGF